MASRITLALTLTMALTAGLGGCAQDMTDAYAERYEEQRLARAKEFGYRTDAGSKNDIPDDALPPVPKAYNPRAAGKNFYLAGSGALTLTDDARLEEKRAGSLLLVDSSDLSTDLGYAADVALGAYAGMFRFEIDGGWRSNKFDQTGFDGKQRILSVMGNGYVDMPLNRRMDFYIGGGIGAARMDVSLDGGIGPFTTSIGGKQWTLAYQGMTGLIFHLNDFLSLTGGYRIFATSNISFDGANYETPLIHNIELGLRWSF